MEYFVKMELTMLGFRVYGTEVDDCGVDFLAQYADGAFLKVQVKSLRDYGYVFMEKSTFKLHEHRLLAFGFLAEGELPKQYLVPSNDWLTETPLLRNRDYGQGKISPPEWGVNVSRKNMPLLEAYAFEKTAEKIIEASSTPKATP